MRQASFTIPYDRPSQWSEPAVTREPQVPVHEAQALTRESTPEETRQPVRRFGVNPELPWQGHRVPNGFWDVRENRHLFLRWMGQQCGFSKPEDWYAIRKQHFQRLGGGGLFRNQYRSSVLQAMRDFLPHYDWKPWLFGGAPNGFWKVRENRIWYMNWLGERLNIQKTEDWYRITGADFFDNHGGGLLNNHFNASVQALMADFMPDYDWKPWCFASVPQSYWRSVSHRRDYLSWLGNRLGFVDSKDWSRLKREHFYRNGGSGLLVSYYHGSARMAVREYFEDTAKST